MNGWITFQLIVDILLLLLVIVFIMRESRKKQADIPDIEELRSLITEFQSAVEKSQKVAKELDEQLTARRDSLAALSAITPRAQKAEERRPVKSPGETGLNEGSVIDHKKQVTKLYMDGVPKKEIAQRLSIPMPVVELIVTMLDSTETA